MEAVVAYLRIIAQNSLRKSKRMWITAEILLGYLRNTSLSHYR